MTPRVRTLARGFVLACAALAGVARTADAHPLGTYGLGARSSAMAGAVSADVEDFSANYYNPAGLVRAERLRLDLGYQYTAHALRANGRDNGVDPARGISGGIVAPGRVFGLAFAFGLGVHLPDDRISRSRALPQSQPRWELFDNRVQILSIAANLAIAPFPWLRFGGGLSFVASTRGQLAITGDIGFPNANDSRLTHTVDADLASVRYPQAGMQVDLGPDFTFAAVYRGDYRVRLELDAEVLGTVVVGRPTDPAALRIPGTFAFSSRSVAVFQPQQAVLGAAWRPRRGLTLTADLTWSDWSAYENPTARVRSDLALVVPPALAGMLNFNPPPVQTVLPAGFHDTVTPRVGAEWRVPVRAVTLAARAGYRYEPSPVPDQTGATNFMDANRHGISAGGGVALRGLAPVLEGGLALDVHAELQVLEPRTARKADPADPVGDYVMAGEILTLGATLGTRF